MLPSIKNFDPKLYGQLEINFINLVDYCYVLRYIDSVPSNFKVVLKRKEIIANLDFIISLMQNKISIEHLGFQSIYEIDKDAKRKELLDNNYLLNSLSKTDFLKGIEDVSEFSIDQYNNFIEITYQTDVKWISSLEVRSVVTTERRKYTFY